MVNQQQTVKQSHNIILENRNMLSISGVTDVESFDENTIVLFTQLGELTVQGKDLHINAMSTDSGDLSVEGDIWSIIYGDKEKKSPVSFFAKLFK